MSNELEEIRCPFYIYSPRRGGRHFPYGLMCEGPVDDSCVKLSFLKKEEYLKYKTYFCESIEHFPYCPFYKLAIERYV